MADLKTIADLQPHPRNPREISEAALAGLGASIADFGDLGAITWNKRNGLLVCGHQRIKALGEGATVFPGVDTSDASTPPDSISQIGVSVTAANGERFPVRVVDWPEDKHLAAMIVANSPHIAGQWLPELGGALDELSVSLGDDFGELKLDELRADVPEGEPEPGEGDAEGEGRQGPIVACPVCGATFRPGEE